MDCAPLSLGDKKLFDGFLRRQTHTLSVYAFENVYIWKGLYEISWAVIEDNLCVFFKDAQGTFLYFPPLGERTKPKAIESVFTFMETCNRYGLVSRIENTEEEAVNFFRGLGYSVADKFGDYLCSRKKLAELKGGAFKSQRASVNFFLKNYHGEFCEFRLNDAQECLALYGAWARRKKEASAGSVYTGMLEDSRSCLGVLCDDWKDLSFVGRVVRIGGRIKGFTFGYRVSADIFCIAFEITDLSVKGLAQYMFRQFCAELKEYSYINIMDDSGQDNLKKVKLSYHPDRIVPAYIVSKQ